MQAAVATDVDFSQLSEGAVSSLDSNTLGTERWHYTPTKFSIKENSVENWLAGKEPGTQAHYGLFMDRFLVWAEPRLQFNTPEGFLAWADAENEHGKKLRKVMDVQNVLRRFSETQKPSQRPYALSGLKTYLELNGFERQLPKVKTDPTLLAWHRGYTRTEIISLKSYLTHSMQKFYIDCNKDSGLRAGDLLSTRYHHLAPDLEAGLDTCHFYFEPKYFPPIRKKKYAGITFIGTNAVAQLREWVETGIVKTKGDPLVFPFGYSTITESIRRARDKAKLPKTIQPNHGLRKFFENALDKPTPPLDDVRKQKIEGHSIGIRWVYRPKDPDELRPLYKQAYPFLDLSENAAASQEIKGLQDEIAKLRTENQRLSVFESRLDEMERNWKQLGARAVS